MRGIYCLVLRLDEDRGIRIGGMGTVPFRKGFYCYIGSAMVNLEKRIERHYSRKKKRFWHVDYLLEHAKPIGFRTIEVTNREECWLADQVRKISDGEVARFGSSDCGCSSHLQYFTDNPLDSRKFSRIFRPVLEDLMKSYARKRIAIKRRLLEFREMWKEPDEKIFSELCFCLCTPQTGARACNKAITALEKTNILFRGDEEEIRRHLVGVRFSRNKSRYMVQARNLFSRGGEMAIKEKIRFSNPVRLREWLVSSVKGMGYKEASHFLRNIGFGEDLAILDRHILKNLLKHGIIAEVPRTLTPKKYLEIEGRMKKFSKRIDIPIAELDLLFWSEETGEIFK
jgi:N-glycosylase/DNA lyase